MKEKRHPKSKKTFWYITGLLSLLTVFSCVYFGTYISQLLRNDNESAEINRSLQLLERAAYQSDDLFRSLSYQMESLLWNESGIALLVNPFAADESALQNCLLNLQQNAASNQFVNEILLYSPISNKVYSSRRTHVPLSYSARNELVTRFYYDSAADMTRRNAIDVKFVTTESDYFLVFEIRMPRLIGVMICHLNHRVDHVLGVRVRLLIDLRRHFVERVLRLVERVDGGLLIGTAAAGGQRQAHHQRQQKRDQFFHWDHSS